MARTLVKFLTFYFPLNLDWVHHQSDKLARSEQENGKIWGKNSRIMLAMHHLFYSP